MSSLSGKATCHRHRKEFALCKAVLSGAITVHPSELSLLQRRGQACVALKQYEDAVRDLSVVHNAEPDNESVLEPLASCLLRLKRAKEGLAVLRAHSQPPPLLMAELCLKGGQHGDALPLLLALSDKEGVSHQVYYLLSLAHVAAGDSAKALAAAQRVLELKPKHKRANHLVARLSAK